MPDISVVIPTLGNYTGLQRVLDSLEVQQVEQAETTQESALRA